VYTGIEVTIPDNGFAMRHWLKYQRQSLKYHMEIADNIYCRNVFFACHAASTNFRTPAEFPRP
jgi:hypothetical protein